MNKEDYFKYYIQGSDHYLIPKDVFIELFDEMENWREEAKELKEKYLNAVADYETTMFEKEQLNSLVNSCQEEIRRLKKQLENKYSKTGILTNEVLYEENTKLINQQKEFIEYLEDEKDRLARECSNIYEDSLGHTRLVNEDKFNEVNDILQKYRSIIGVSDENNIK